MKGESEISVDQDGNGLSAGMISQNKPRNVFRQLLALSRWGFSVFGGGGFGIVFILDSLQ